MNNSNKQLENMAPLEKVSPETNPEHLQKLIESMNKVAHTGSLNRKTIWRNFVLGIATAFGATVGLAVVLSLLGLIVKIAGGVPFVGNMLLRLGYFLHK